MTAMEGAPADGRSETHFLSAATAIHTKEVSRMTKSEEVFEKVEQLIAGGTSKADAFKHLAEEYGQPVNSVRGSYYQHTRSTSGSKPRRRETTPEDALADARKALERAIESVDREVEQAKLRADEAKAEYDALRSSAKERREAIAARLEALT
jgi:hypothetical protein